MNLTDLNPFKAVVGGVVDTAKELLTRYVPSELERAKAFAEIDARVAETQARLEQIAADDRKSARDMQVATRSWVPDVLALLITAGFFGFLFYLMEYEPPAGSKDILNIMLGSLGTAWLCVVYFYYGSTIQNHRNAQAGRAK